MSSTRRIADLIKMQSGIIKTIDYRQLLNSVRDAIHLAILNAVREHWGDWQHIIALDTGRLRLGIEAMIDLQIRALQGGEMSTFQIIFTTPLSPNYAPYHIIGPDGLAEPGWVYTKPTTTGTTPLDEKKFMLHLGELIRKHLIIEFKREGLQWDDDINVSVSEL